MNFLSKLFQKKSNTPAIISQKVDEDNIDDTEDTGDTTVTTVTTVTPVTTVVESDTPPNNIDVAVKDNNVPTPVPTPIPTSAQKTTLTPYINQCEEIKTTVFDKAPTKTETYLNQSDFSLLEQEYVIIKLTQNLMQFSLFEQDEQDEQAKTVNDIAMLVTQVYNLKKELDANVQELVSVGNTLKTDIENFTTAVNEVRNKYKLSPDWNGKKQPLMSLGEKLQIRRDDYVAKETELDKKITSLYKDFTSAHDIVRKNIDTVIDVLNCHNAQKYL